MSEKYDITRDYVKSNWEILRSQIIGNKHWNKVSQDFFESQFILLRMHSQTQGQQNTLFASR